jgi:ribokinase
LITRGHRELYILDYYTTPAERRLTDIRILIIGGASLDTLDGSDALVAGGAGMYTALASRRTGADVTLFAPRPDPMPEALRPVAERLTWLGPRVSREDLAHFEISYRDGRTTYVHADFGAETTLSPHDLPDDLSGFNCVHLVPLGDLCRQYAFLLACRERGARSVSAGTALHLINDRPADAQAILRHADFCFMNEEEALRMFGSSDAIRARSGQVIFITRGSNGASVVQGDELTQLSGERAGVVDPTGAGDTFCGATLAGLCAGRHPVMAARHAMPLSAQAIGRIGPAALLQTTSPPSPAGDRRVVVNSGRVGQVAMQIAGLPEVTPFAPMIAVTSARSSRRSTGRSAKARSTCSERICAGSSSSRSTSPRRPRPNSRLPTCRRCCRPTTARCPCPRLSCTCHWPASTGATCWISA